MRAVEKCKSVNLPRCSSPRNQIADEREIRAPMLIHGKRGEDSCTCFVKIEKRREGERRKSWWWQEEKKTRPFFFPLFPTFRSFDSLSFTPSSSSSLFSRKRNFVCCVPSRVTRKMLVPAYQEARKATTDRSTLKKDRKK